jgi:ketosteroid isomerase-like protein
MFRSLGVLIVCGVLTSCVTSQPATETVEMEVQQASDRFWTTRERGDASSLAAQVTETAILMVPGLPDAVGRSAVRDLLQQRFASARTSDFKVHRREIQVIGNSAYELAWYSETYHGEDESLRLEGRYLIVWKRGRDDPWRVHRNLYNFSAATPVKASSN